MGGYAIPIDDEDIGVDTSRAIPVDEEEKQISAAPTTTPTNAIPVQLHEPHAPGAAVHNTAQVQPHQSALASLWSKADNIHNPVLRVLGKIGAGAAKAIDIGASTAVPGLAANIPGTQINADVTAARQNKAAATEAGLEHTQAQTRNENAEAAQRENPQAKPKEESWEVLAGYKGPNGEPVMREKNSGDIRVGQVPDGVKPTEGEPKDSFQLWRQQNPQGKVEDWFDMQAKNKPQKEPNAAESVKESIAQAFDAGDLATVKKLQNKLKAIDPMGAQRIQIALGNQDLSRDKASRQDVREHDKAYVQPAEGVEKSFQMMQHAYDEYKDAKAHGKELPTGAQSMLALSTHLATTFGNVKGARVTKDMIEHHLGARSISDSALVAMQKLTNGDTLSPAQWDAFHDLIKQSRDLSWKTAVKEAKRKDVPVDFLPEDLQGQIEGGNGAPPAGSKVRDYSQVK
jgi:hypothetical protein